jgi:hypothetical protein
MAYPQMPMTLPQANPLQSMPGLQPPDIPQIKSSGGMFGGGGKGIAQAILAALNGYLASQNNPVGLANLQAMQQERQRQYEEAQYQQHSQSELQRQKDLYSFELANPKPDNNDTANDYQFISQILGPDAGKQFLQTKADPAIVVQTPYGPMPMLRSQVGGSIPAKPVGGLTPIGGPTPQASGGFSGY